MISRGASPGGGRRFRVGRVAASGDAPAAAGVGGIVMEDAAIGNERQQGPGAGSWNMRERQWARGDSGVHIYRHDPLQCAKFNTRGSQHDEARQAGRWLAGGLVYASQGPRSRGHRQALEGDAHQEHLQDLRPGHGGPGRRHGERAGPLPRGLQEIATGDGLGHAGEGAQRVLHHLFAPAVAGLFAPRAGNLRPAHGPAVARGRRKITGRSAGTTRWGALPRSCRPSLRARRSGMPAVAARTRPAFCCNCSPGCTAPTTSTIAATIAIRPVAWD